MVIVYKGDNRLEGLSSDTKPTDVPKLTRFLETNTNIEWIFNTIGVWQQFGVGASVSESTTVSNASVGGVAITLPQSGYNLPFKGIAAGSSGNITVTDDPTNKNIVVDFQGPFDFDKYTIKHQGGGFEYKIDYDSSRSSKYIARNLKTGSVISSGSTLDVVMVDVFAAIAALTYFGISDTPRGGSVYVGQGYHQVSGSFAGLNIPEMTDVIMPHNCFIEVPQGYASYVFGMTGYTTGQSSPYWGSSIQGGYLREGGTQARLWDGIKMTCVNPDSSGSLYGCSVNGTQIAYAKNGIRLTTTDTNGLSYINGCNFYTPIFSDCVNMINFDQNNMPLYTGGTGFANRNEFYSIVGQSGSHTVYGVKDITGTGNIFIGCKIWDVGLGGAGSVTSNITAAAKNTQIYGGIMTSQNFTDLGIDTYINDDITGLVKKITNSSSPKTKIGATWLGDLSTESNTISPLRDGTSSQITFLNYNTNGTLGVYFQPNTDSQTTTVNIANRTVSERFYIQKNTTQYLFDFVKQTSGGSLRPALFRMLDIPSSSTVESFRIDTDAITKFAKPIDLNTNTTPSNPATGAGRLYVKSIDVNNDGVFALIKKSGSFVEVQIL